MNSDDQLHDSIEAGLTAAADDVDLGDPSTMLGDVRATVQHRRRRRQVFTGVAAAGALAVSGVVLANVVSNDGSDLIVSAPVDEPADTTVDTGTGAGTGDSVRDDATPAVEESPSTTALDPGQSNPGAVGEPLRVTSSRAEGLVDGGLSIEVGNGGGAQLFAWKGGFLALYTQYTPQPLPAELPASVVEQFPQEVQDLFVDGLPSTIDEAIAMLQDAGLYDEVADIVTSNPEVQEAIYGEPSEPVTTLRSSADGVEWSDVDASFPVPPSSWTTSSSTGERFVIVTQTGGGFGPDPDADADPDAAPTMDVWSSTDLVTWESQSIALPTTPVDQPEFLRTQFGARSVAVTDAAWVVSVDTYTDIDTDSFLDDADRALSQSGSVSVETSSDDEGLTIEIYEIDEEYSGEYQERPEPRTITRTWAELGLDGSPYDGQGSAVAYSATWGGEPRSVETGPASTTDSSQVMAAGDGFVAFGEDLALSSDGVTWSPVGIPVDGYVEWVIDTDDGLLVSVSPFDGPAVRYLFDPALTEFSPVDLDDVPAGSYAEQRDRRAVVLADYGEGGDDTFGSGGSLAVAEVDGYRFELEVRMVPPTDIDGEAAGSVMYTLTDIASGNVVSTETLDAGGDVEFEFAKEEYDLGAGNEEGFHLLDPSTGEELVQVPYSAMTFTTLDADGNPIEGSEITVPAVDEYTTPDQWLVAAVGDSLIVEQLATTQPDQVVDEVGDGTDEFVDINYLSSVVTGSDAVLLAYSDGSMIRVTPDS